MASSEHAPDPGWPLGALLVALLMSVALLVAFVLLTLVWPLLALLQSTPPFP